MRRDCHYVRARSQNNKRARKVLECCSAPQRDSAKTRAQNSTKQSGRNGAAALLIHKREELRERGCIVAGKSPPDAADGQEGADDTDQEGKADDEEKTKGGSVVASGLRVDLGEGEGAVAIEDVVEVRNTVEDGYGIEE